MGLIDTMAGFKYLRMEEVPQIPTRRTPFHVAVYTPLDAAPVPPDVVPVGGNARQLMLLSEAAHAAGLTGQHLPMGRPTCAVLPEAINSARTAASFGCIGNRVYTAAADDDAYFAIPGEHLPSDRGAARRDCARQRGAREVPPRARCHHDEVVAAAAT